MFRVLGLVLLVSSAWSWVPHPHRATVRPSAVTPLPGIRSSSAKLLGRLRPKRKVEDQAPLIIAVGARLPETDVQVQVADDNKEAGAGDQTFLEAVGTGSRAIVLGRCLSTVDGGMGLIHESLWLAESLSHTQTSSTDLRHRHAGKLGMASESLSTSSSHQH
jgi:hypothetical protein